MVLQTSAAFVGAKDRAAGLQGGADLLPDRTDRSAGAGCGGPALLRTRQAESELRRLNRQLEQRVAERTGELEEANRRLQSEIEERRRTETALRLAEKMELVGQLTGGIAHDFNNLLTVISGNLELLSDAVSGKPVDAPRLQRIMGAAQNAANQAARLTRRLLVLSRRDDPRPQPARIGRILSGLEEFIRRTLGEAISLGLSIEPEGWPCSVDQIQFETAVLNLAVNARDAMPDGGAFVVRTANVTVGGSDRTGIAGWMFRWIFRPATIVLLTASDTGIGMDRMYWNVRSNRSSRRRMSEGQRARPQSGPQFCDVRIRTYKSRSAPGRGTSFHLYLPRSAQEERPGKESEEADRVARGGCETILVVEDDPGVLEVALRTIRGFGYDVTTG